MVDIIFRVMLLAFWRWWQNCLLRKNPSAYTKLPTMNRDDGPTNSVMCMIQFSKCYPLLAIMENIRLWSLSAYTKLPTMNRDDGPTNSVMCMIQFSKCYLYWPSWKILGCHHYQPTSLWRWLPTRITKTVKSVVIVVMTRWISYLIIHKTSTWLESRSKIL